MRDPKRTMGCAVFAVVGIGWVMFTILLQMGNSLGDCASSDRFCELFKKTYEALIFWRGVAVGLFLIIAYLLYRHFFEGDDVQ